MRQSRTLSSTVARSVSAKSCRRPSIKIVEVSPRDGLQNEAIALSAAVRARLIARLAGHGFKSIEAGSFVSRKLKQMANTDAVLCDPALQTLPRDTCLSVLVPNMQGFERFKAAKAASPSVGEVAVFVAASEGFSQANLNAGIAKTIENAAEVATAAKELGMRVRGYVSCVVGVGRTTACKLERCLRKVKCPFEGTVQPTQVQPVVKALLEMGCDEVSLGDTIGVGTPSAIERLLNYMTTTVPIPQLAMCVNLELPDACC